MDYEKKVPEWHAEGTEPPESLKQSGFEAGYKPPAAYFNWFWNRVSACLTEIRSKLSGHAANKENPHGVTAAQVGLDKVNNTSDAEKNVAFASESASSRKVENSLVLRFNGGGVENTNLFTYHGSGGKSVNITPDKINAAEKDLSNVDEDTFKAKATDSGVGIPIAAATSADGIAYTATVEGVTELYNGLIITIVPDINSASTTPTLDVNGIGAKMVRLPLSFNNAAMTTPRLDTYISAGRPLTLQYDAAYLNNDGIWKVFGKQRTSAQDLYGTVPIEGGGTDATTTEKARENLDVPSNAEMHQRDRVVNLLDNSDFRNPVMQAGFNGKHGNDTYIIDRWMHLYNLGTVTLVSDGIKLSGYNLYMHQRLDVAKYAGKTLTFAVHLSGGKTVCGTIAADDIISNAGYVVISQYEKLILQAHDGGISIRLGENSPDYILQWAALYEGEYTAETLPTYQPKGYAHELMECMRYYQNINVVWGTAAGSTTRQSINLTPMMRINPTVTGKYAQAGSVDDISFNYTGKHLLDMSFANWGAGGFALSADL